MFFKPRNIMLNLDSSYIPKMKFFQNNKSILNIPHNTNISVPILKYFQNNKSI